MSFVSSVSSRSAVGTDKPQKISAIDKEIQQLNKQKAQLQEDLQKINANMELDSRTKMERSKSITSNIQQIESRISDIKMEQMQKNVQEQRPQDQPNGAPSDIDPHLVAIVPMTGSVKWLPAKRKWKAKFERWIAA